MNFDLSQRQFKEFASIAYARAGIRLNQGKESLVGARIAKRIRVLGLENPQQYLDHLTHCANGEELTHFLDVISTNFTSFFRELDHFDVLSDLVKRRTSQGCCRLRFWSAACSSGEEPYSMAMTLSEVADPGVDWRILATDISQRILEFARNGRYPRSRLENVSKSQLKRHFYDLGPKGSEDRLFEVQPELREHVAFHRLNLAAPPYPMRGPLDLVMCRNVMIYFDEPVRQALVSNIETLLAPGGLLIVGHAETLSGLATRCRLVRPSIYERRDSNV